MLGFGCPELGKRPIDFVTTAPAPLPGGEDRWVRKFQPCYGYHVQFPFVPISYDRFYESFQ